ncbi:MFS transporter [Streptomyces johnsoniae]|uniref:Tetracycline resistance protein n=1 Tax=Streptomyces johnsoniae TaxID=3075532 RepID=A0ABU2S4B6_9ACTN|nr:MFS transporter [Streptomyces sp. DSM 41886]MDT0443828.1 MFS transporter [Streptomyces sp. DSM 41886]
MSTRSAVSPTAAPPRSGSLSARSAGLRYGALFGPAVFGVTAAGVALPDVSASLDATPSAVAWVLTAHALALGVGTALFGRLSDSRGLRTSLLLGSLVLAVGAAVCLLAPNLGVLVAGRFVLALGSGAMTSGAVTLSASAEAADRPKVLAGFGATMAVFSASATLAGGVFTEWVTWRVALVLPALSLIAVPLCLRPAAARQGSGRPLDLPGATLLTVAATSFLLLIQASALEIAAGLVVVLAVALVLSVVLLARRVRTVPASFVPRRLVGDNLYLRTAVTGVGVYAGLFAAMYAVPQILVQEHGWSVLAVGTWLLPGAVVGAVLSRLAGRLPAAGGGSVLLALIACAMAATLASALGTENAALPVIGASLGFAAFAVTQVVSTALMSARVEPALRGGAMGLLNLTFFVGGGVGSATAGALAKSVSLYTTLGLVAGFPLLAAAFAVTLTGHGGPRGSKAPQAR